jgi:hypothetical protein
VECASLKSKPNEEYSPSADIAVFCALGITERMLQSMRDTAGLPGNTAGTI